MVNSEFLQCAGCDKPIFDRYLMNVLDRSWHASCVKCYECKISLKDKCFSRGGKLYCKEDFFRIFGTKCAGCTTGISPDDLVRRARGRVFHLKCFTCMVCRRQLSTGEELYVVDGSQFMCKDDYISTVQGMDGEGMSSPLPDTDDINYSSDVCNNDNNNLSSGYEHNSSTAQTIKTKGIIKKKSVKPKKSPKKQSEFDVNEEDSMDLPSSPLSNDSDRSDGEDSPEKSNGKSKDDDDENDKGNLSKRRGPRTTIKAKQYEMLRASFVATPKPTRQIREQLANDTGLTMRVIQVWFQNRRSKERRMKTLAFGKGRNVHRGSNKRSRSNGVPHDESSNLMNGYEYSEDERLHYSNNNVQSFRELLEGKELGNMNCDSLSSPGCNTQNDNMNSNESASGFRDSPYSSQDIPINGIYSMPFQNSDMPFQSDSVLSSPSDSGLTSHGYGLTRTEISSEMW